MSEDAVTQLRRFNRTVSQTFGLLEDSYLGSSRRLAECRLIFEVGTTGASVHALRSRLGLDSGYLSRLLRSLEAQELIETSKDPEDQRVRIAKLTRAGLRELETLDRLSNDLASSVIEPLSESQRARPASAIETAERLLSAAGARIEEINPSDRDAQHCLSLYYAELRERFETSFEPDYESAPALVDFAPPHGSFLLVRQQDVPVGCGGLKQLDDCRACLKRMWIAETHRGLGLGRRLVDALEKRAEALGYRFVCLETNAALTEAQHLYPQLGYRKVAPFNDDPYADLWFQKTL